MLLFVEAFQFAVEFRLIKLLLFEVQGHGGEADAFKRGLRQLQFPRNIHFLQKFNFFPLFLQRLLQSQRYDIQSLQNVEFISFAAVARSPQSDTLEHILLLAVNAVYVLLLLDKASVVFVD